MTPIVLHPYAHNRMCISMLDWPRFNRLQAHSTGSQANRQGPVKNENQILTAL
jgi:hypothetical protein